MSVPGTPHNKLFGLNTEDYRHNPASQAANDFVVGEAGTGNWVRKSLADTLALLGATAMNTTKLAITGTKAALSVYTITSSGFDYTKSGDDGVFPASAALFNYSEYIHIFFNGVYQEKGVNVVWQSITSFTLDTIVNNGDEVVILS